ncbi:MAG: hypothetical protein HKN04_11660 [Rhodothermaceae bacterium]|nr:hypothetical protein [Rhodothermaceae bacterium]
MPDAPSTDALTAALTAALAAAGQAHHEYEQHALGGTHDEQWPAFYAAYVLGRLGDFVSPTDLARWLEDTPGASNWAAAAAAYVQRQLGA